MKNNDSAVSQHCVVSGEEWLEARRALLSEEKEESKRRDEFTERQRGIGFMAALDLPVHLRATWGYVPV